MKNPLLLVFILLLFQKNHAQLPLFTQMKPTETGVNFNNALEDRKNANILIYSNFYGGAGVAVADFNLDGLPDLYFAGNQVHDRLYINKGGLRFEDISKKIGLDKDDSWSSGICIADVNLDGLPDIYVTKELYDEDPERRRNKLYINKGNLVFSEEAAVYKVDDPERTRHAGFLDYNRDGLPDLLLLNQPPNPGSYSDLKNSDLKKPHFSPRLLQNTGKEFVDVTSKAGIGIPGFGNSIALADLNQDGWTDIFISNDFESPDRLWINNGDGTFTEKLQQSMNHISFYSMGVDAGDINNDGLLDLLVLDMVAEDNYRLKANMSGMDPSAFWKVVDQGGHYQYMFNNLHLNMGNMHFTDVAQLAGMSNTDWSWSNVFADFDNDGWKDAYITNGLLRDIRNSDAAKEFPKYVNKVLTDYIQKNPDNPNVTIWDILDLKKALEIVPSQKIPNYAFRNKGDLTFENTTVQWGLSIPSFSNGCAYADLDRDGDLDIIVNNINEAAYIFRNNAEKSKTNYLRLNLHDKKHRSTLGAKITITTNTGIQFFETMNVRGMYSASEETVHFGLGNQNEVSQVHIEWPNGTTTDLKDIKANQILDVYMPDTPFGESQKRKMPLTFFEESSISGLEAFHVENGFDDFEKQVLLPHKMSQFGPALAVGDVNGDRLEDIFLGGAAGQPAQLFFQEPNGRFRKDSNDRWEKDKLSEDTDAIFFDLDKDGDLDLYVVSGGNEAPAQNSFYQDRIYLNAGDGRFVKYNMPRLTESGSVVRAHDFDNDGFVDLFVGGRHKPQDYPMPASSHLLRNQNGMLIDVTSTVIPGLKDLGLVTDAVWADLDGDKIAELVVTGEWMSVHVFKKTGESFKDVSSDFGTDGRTGWHFSLEAIDADNDGDMDLMVGNLGLNYKYKATANEPFDVYYEDFDENGSRDIVLGYYNGGKHFPVRGRSCSSQQVPEIKEKFETYHLFASSELEEIYGEKELKESLHLSATNFSNYILWNEQGKFRVENLPNEFQTGNINDWLVLPGKEDEKLVIGVGGLFTAEIETTRNDASEGYLFQLTKNGLSQIISPSKSGLYLPFDSKKARTIQIGTESYLLVANNNGKLQLFRIQGERFSMK